MLSANCLYILCGTAFSGKTTLARELCRAIDCVCVSLDEINAERGLYGGDGIPTHEWERTHKTALQRLSELMTERRDIVLDDSCCFRWLRDRYRSRARESRYTAYLVYLDVPREEIDRRIKANASLLQRRTVTPGVLAAHMQTFEKPVANEAAIVLNSPESISKWIASLLNRPSV